MKTTEERFWEKVAKGEGCWEWTASRNPRGYGRFRYNGKAALAHRVAWALESGGIPEGFFVCHHCDNPACVRPGHLFVGTNADNVRDMVGKNRGVYPYGEWNGKSKLTVALVLEARNLHRSGLSLREIGRRFGLRHQTVSRAVAGITWQEVPQ